MTDWQASVTWSWDGSLAPAPPPTAGCTTDQNCNNGDVCDGMVCVPDMGGAPPTLIEIELMCPTEYVACTADPACPGELAAALAAPDMPSMTGSAAYVATITCVMAAMGGGDTACPAELTTCFASPTCSAIMNADPPDMTACQADADCGAFMTCELSSEFGPCLDPAAGQMCTMDNIMTMISIDPSMDDAAIMAIMNLIPEGCRTCTASLQGDGGGGCMSEQDCSPDGSMICDLQTGSCMPAAPAPAPAAGAPCFRGGCDTGLADAATDAGACAAAGAQCVFDANADPNMGEYMCAGPQTCPTETAAMMTAMTASADPGTFMMNADGSMNLAEPTIAAMYQCSFQCQMPDDTTCSAEIVGMFTNGGAGMNAIMTEDDPATTQDEAMEACMAHAECAAWFTCAMSGQGGQDPSPCPGDSSRDEGAAFTPCINDAACMAILAGMPDDPSQDDVYTSGCGANALCCDVASCQGMLCAATPPPPTAGVQSAVEVVATDGVAGMTTVRLKVTMDATQMNVYAMSGTATLPMSFPAAFQVAAPFGADIGGANAAFFAIMADTEFDSWLTVGSTDGTIGGAIAASPGFGDASCDVAVDGCLGNLGLWSETAGISTTNAAIFYMTPGDGPAGADIVVAQITAPTGIAQTATAGLQGKTVIEASCGGAAGCVDWQLGTAWSW